MIDFLEKIIGGVLITAYILGGIFSIVFISYFVATILGYN